MPALFSYPKSQKLKSRKQIEILFSNNRSLYSYPLKILYQYSLHSTHQPYLQAGVTVSSRHFKKATQRNRIKRLLREAYRTNKVSLQHFLELKQVGLTLFIIYVGKEMPDIHILNRAVQKLLPEIFNVLLHEMDTTSN
jgi:ribonuclease P protein component